MLQHQRELTLATRGAGLSEITGAVADVVSASGIALGLVTVFCRHTSCSLILNENADRDVRADLLAFFQRLVPDGDALFTHRLEGPDDMPAHIKTALTASTLSIPVRDGHMLLGTWQGIYLFEHRHNAHRRSVVVHALGEGA